MWTDVKRYALRAALLCVALIALENVFLLTYLDRRVVWRDADFLEYIAEVKPQLGQVRDLHALCQIKPIAIIYRYQICINGAMTDTAGTRLLFVEIARPGGFFSLLPDGLTSDRIVYDKVSVLQIDRYGMIVDDRRMKK